MLSGLNRIFLQKTVLPNYYSTVIITTMHDMAKYTDKHSLA